MKPIIHESTKITPTTKLTMEEDTVIGDFCFINCKELVMLEGAQLNRFVSISGGRERVVIGRYATVSNYASLKTASDTPYGSMNDQAEPDQRRIKSGEIIIGNNAFIGEYASIMPGVAIGDGTVIGAYSYISKDVPPWHITHPPRARSISVFRRLDSGVEMKDYPEELKKLAEEEIIKKGGFR